MNKKIYILGVLISLIALVVAQSIGNVRTTERLSGSKLNVLKSEYQTSRIDIQVSNLECKDYKCKAETDGIIQKEYWVSRYKCTNYDYKKHSCLSKQERTGQEMRAEIDNRIREDLDNLAEEIIKTQTKEYGGLLEVR